MQWRWTEVTLGEADMARRHIIEYFARKKEVWSDTMVVVTWELARSSNVKSAILSSNAHKK